MKLAHVIDEESALPESLKDYYAEVDGKWYLQVEGMVPKSRVDEFRENNIELLKVNQELTQRVSAFGDLTPEQLAELRARAEKGGEGIPQDQLDAMVLEQVQKRTAKMREEYEEKLQLKDKRVNAAESQLSETLIDNGITQAAVKAGIRDTAIPDVLLRARTVFKVKEGRAVPMSGEEVIYGKDGQSPMTMTEWLAERTGDAPHWFNEPKGTGSRHSSGAGGANTAPQQNVRGVDRMRAART